MISVRNLGASGLSNPGRMVDGNYMTVEEKHMWVGHMPLPPNNVEIIVQINENINIGGIKIWNYNKSLLESVKGVRDLEIYIEGRLVWSGEV